jgi:DNA-binding transcriptional MerR regulator
MNQTNQTNEMTEVQIPNKQYFKIGEVSSLTQLESYVLRYWETEFKSIRPVRMGSNQRMYRRKDVETILEIKKLLYDEGFTIAGAKKKISQTHKLEKESSVVKEDPPGPPSEPLRNLLQEVRDALLDLRQVLSR